LELTYNVDELVAWWKRFMANYAIDFENKMNTYKANAGVIDQMTQIGRYMMTNMLESHKREEIYEVKKVPMTEEVPTTGNASDIHKREEIYELKEISTTEEVVLRGEVTTVEEVFKIKMPIVVEEVFMIEDVIKDNIGEISVVDLSKDDEEDEVKSGSGCVDCDNLYLIQVTCKRCYDSFCGECSITTHDNYCADCILQGMELLKEKDQERSVKRQKQS
jgi:hypothetical protein